MKSDLFEECVKYRKWIFNYFYKITGYDYELSQDLTQQTFLKVYTFFNKYSITEKEYLPTWCLKVAKNIHIDHMRKKREILESEMCTDHYKDFNFEKIVSDFDIEIDFENKDLKRRFDLIFNSLSPNQKEALDILILNKVNGLNYDEISVIKKLSNDSCRQRTTRIRKVLREKLSEALQN